MPIRALGDFDSAFSNIKEENYLDFSHLGQVIVGYDVPYITFSSKNTLSGRGRNKQILYYIVWHELKKEYLMITGDV